MPSVKDNASFSKQAKELLQLAGYDTLEKLSRASADNLTAELYATNQKRRVYKKLPPPGKIAKWISQAQLELENGPPPQLRDLTESAEPVPVSQPPVNYENDPDVLAMIAVAQLALPLPGIHLAEKKISVSSIPPAILLSSAIGDVSLRAGVKPTQPKVEKNIDLPVSPKSATAPLNYVNSISFGNNKAEMDKGKIRSTNEFLKPGAELIPILTPAPFEIPERTKLLRTARSETNEGKDSSSRWYIRGVLHDRPYLVWFGAFITIACQVLIPLGIISGILLILSDTNPKYFDWFPFWALIFPCLLPIFGLLYFIISFDVRCRICGQKCFVPRDCLKNRKAHHISGLGHIFPVATHILLFRWFRCTHCGTSVRIKE